MAKIEKFEDIDAWKEARKLTNMIYKVSEEAQFAQDFSLKNQVRSASVSVMSNIAEGFDRQTNKEFIQFFVIARSSTSEVKSHLYVALDRQYIDHEVFSKLYQQATKVTSLIDGFIRYLKKPRT